MRAKRVPELRSTSWNDLSSRCHNGSGHFVPTTVTALPGTLEFLKDDFNQHVIVRVLPTRIVCAYRSQARTKF